MRHIKRYQFKYLKTITKGTLKIVEEARIDDERNVCFVVMIVMIDKTFLSCLSKPPQANYYLYYFKPLKIVCQFVCVCGID